MVIVLEAGLLQVAEKVDEDVCHGVEHWVLGVTVEQVGHDVFMIAHQFSQSSDFEMSVIIAEVFEGFLYDAGCLAHGGDDNQQVVSIFSFDDGF